MHLRILVAEDSELNYEMVAEFLRFGGHALSWARDGLEALATLADGGFDLLLLDLHMPAKDGYQVLAAARANPRLASLKIIVLSADAMAGVRENALAAGADLYLSKPLDLMELDSAMRQSTGAGSGYPNLPAAGSEAPL